MTDTYEDARIHRDNNGELPRRIWSNIDGTRSLQYLSARKLLKPYKPRLFDGWLCWQEDFGCNHNESYNFGFVPMR